MAHTFSVAMCTYNGASYVEDQLESIAAQTQPPEELIVCDDGSSDATLDIIKEFSSRAPFPVRLFVNEHNLGSTKNFERAIALCSGDLISLCDQDDVWLPSKLARLHREFARAPSVGLVFSDAEVGDEHARSTGHGLWETIGIDRAELERLKAGTALGDLLRGATVTGATMAFRAQLRHLVLPFPQDLPLIHDGWIALITACVAHIAPIEDRLLVYRSHRDQQVGPLGRLKSQGGLRAVTAGEMGEARRRSNPYESTLRVAQAVRDRLQETRGSEFEFDSALKELDSRIAHLRARATMPQRKLSRLPYVLRELSTWRYNLYSNGLYSALKDLLD